MGRFSEFSERCHVKKKQEFSFNLLMLTPYDSFNCVCTTSFVTLKNGVIMFPNEIMNFVIFQNLFRIKLF